MLRSANSFTMLSVSLNCNVVQDPMEGGVSLVLRLARKSRKLLRVTFHVLKGGGTAVVIFYF